MAKLEWAEMSLLQKTAIVSVGIVQFGLLGAALLDLSRRPSEQINGPKRFWLPVLFVNFFGPLAYFKLGRKAPD